MNANVGTDANSGLAHLVVGSAAHVDDFTQTEHLPLGKEDVAFADAKRTPQGYHSPYRAAQGAELGRSEHPLHVLKNQLRRRKARKRG